MIEEQHHVTCSEGHIAENSLLQRFNLTFGAGGWTSLDPPIDRNSLIPIAIPEARNTMDPPCEIWSLIVYIRENVWFFGDGLEVELRGVEGGVAE